MGASAPTFTSIETWLLGPVGYSKFYVPVALFILGLGAWTFFRQLKFSPLAAALGALATALNSGYVGNACWGTASLQIAVAAVFFALALVMANTDETPRLVRWSRLALAGMAVGVSVMEGADNGAIFSLFVAAFVFFKSLIERSGPALEKVGRGIGRVAVIAVFAGLIAAQTITSLLGAFASGTAGMGQDQNMESKQEHWDWATEWSLPKAETLGIFVPGVFGYRMDTPKNMMDFVEGHYAGGEYWGGMGRSPTIDRFFDNGVQGKQPDGLMRFGYAGYYVGILVALVALFALVQSFRRENSVFPEIQKRFIWFWAAALIISLLLSWGRFAPFYQFLYMLPYFSTIRNPAKFLAIFDLAIVIIFAYGIDGLSRCYLQVATTTAKPDAKPVPLSGRFKNWWQNFRFDRNWVLFCIGAFILSAVACSVYSSHSAGMIHYLQKVGFPDVDSAKQIFGFSVRQGEWFLLFFAAAIVLFILVVTGAFSGKRAWAGGLLLGAFIVADLGRANLPWIIHWDYKQKYASNDIIDILRDKPYEHRITDLPSDTVFEELYRIEWMQHHFPYYNIQCSDIIQSSRVASDLATYDMALPALPMPAPAYLYLRRWELTNTRYFFGPANYVDLLNNQIDPVQRRFHYAQRFNVVPKPGIDNPMWPEQLTAVTNTNGDYALIEFTAALPRAKLYSDWQVNTNNSDTLKTLTAEDFDPQKTVLVSAPMPGAPLASTGDNSGTVDFKSYAPKDIVLSAQATAPSVLLLNDKYDPNWRVAVDNKPAQLLRCNFIMRGVYLPPGSHTVEFQFSLPNGPLYVTLLAIVSGLFLCGFLIFSTRKPPLETRSIRPSQRDEERRASAGSRSPSSEVRSASH